MRIKLDTQSINYLELDGVPSGLTELDSRIEEIISEKNIDIREYSVSNKYLRAVVRKGDYEYHVLEKPAGVNTLYCVGGSFDGYKKKAVKFNMPFTIMIIKFQEKNGVYYKQADKIFHSNEPVNKRLSNSLWQWGLSNVYDDSHICWGNQGMPEIDDKKSYQFIDEFFLSIKNNDLLKNESLDWHTISTDVVHDLKLESLCDLQITLKKIIDKF